MSQTIQLLRRNIPSISAKQSNGKYHGEKRSYQPSGAPVRSVSVIWYTVRGCHETKSCEIKKSPAVGSYQALVMHKKPSHELSRW